MKYFVYYIIVALLFVFALSPAMAEAQTAAIQASELKQKIAALGTTPVAALPMPVLFGIAPSDLTPNFGVPRTNHPHQGEDIMALKGTPIVSPTEAVVLGTQTGTIEGNMVYTANPGGEKFFYIHLDRFGEGIKAGQVLEPGSLIGYVGNTGDASRGAAHLHFEIHNIADTPIDPFPLLVAEFSPTQKISFLDKILAQTSDATSLSRFLATNFRSTFSADIADNIALPSSITGALAYVPATVESSVNKEITPPSGNLEIGSSGALVVALQKYLIKADSGAASISLAGIGATGKFGVATKAALAEFQKAAGISPVSGYYGPITRAFVAAHPIGSSSIASSSNAIFTRELYMGIIGEDVRALQKLLNDNGYTIASTGLGSPGNETSRFGLATKLAVIKFQIAQKISPAEGNVGPLTRAALASL